VQNTVNVTDFRVLDREWVLAQANAVLADMPVSAVKLGMLGNLSMVETIVELMQDHRDLPLVCDPVLRAGGGGSLGKDEVGYALREQLLPIALIATPNLPEARILAELPAGTADECAAKLLPFCRNLLITGGHGDEREIHNRLYCRDGTQHTFTCQRLPGSYHGSGCTLASALAGRLALGEELVSAVRSALDYTWRTLRDAEQPGMGQYVPRRLPLDFCS
jgi:hydroxymethylpyrimidine/phosphomethylpyrimidine kinase